MGFRLVPTSMNLNDLERRNSLILRFFSTNSIAAQADYPSNIVSQFQSFTFGQNKRTLQRGLFAIAEHLV